MKDRCREAGQAHCAAFLSRKHCPISDGSGYRFQRIVALTSEAVAELHATIDPSVTMWMRATVLRDPCESRHRGTTVLDPPDCKTRAAHGPCHAVSRTGS